MGEPEAGRIETLQKKMEQEPGSKLFLQLAQAHRESGDLEQALEVCRKGLEQNPCYHSARVSLGRLYIEAGQTEQAKRELERVLEAVPDNLLAKRLLDGLPNGAKGSAPATAGPHGTPPPAAAPEPAAGSGNGNRNGPPPMDVPEPDPLETETLAEIYLQQGHPEKAIRIFEKILRANPENGAVRERLARLQNQPKAPSGPVPAAEPYADPARRKIAALEDWLKRIQKG